MVWDYFLAMLMVAVVVCADLVYVDTESNAAYCVFKLCAGGYVFECKTVFAEYASALSDADVLAYLEQAYILVIGYAFHAVDAFNTYGSCFGNCL